MAEGAFWHRQHLGKGRPGPPLAFGNQRLNGVISFEAIACGLGNFGCIGRIQQIESMISVFRIAAESCEVDRKTSQKWVSS